MKRIQPTHGSARVENNCSPETIQALDKLSKASYNHIAKEKELELEIISAKMFIKEKHNGEIPYKFGTNECAKLMALYLIENTRPLTIEEHISQIQRNAHREVL